MEKPLVQLNRFFELAEERMLTGSDQLLYLHLYNIFNRAHWIKKIRIKDRDLQEKMQLHDSTGKPATIETIRAAKSRLKLKGFIDFKAGNGKVFTEYEIIELYPADTPPNIPNDTPQDTPADVSLLSTPLDSLVEKTLRRKDKASAGAETGAREGVLNQEIVNLWRGEIGEIGGYVYQKLFEFQQRYGIEQLKYAITEGIEIHGARLGLRYVRAILEKPQKVKGEVKNGSNRSKTNYNAAFGFEDED